MAIPSYLLSSNGCERAYPLCTGCAESVKQAPTGRWFITMGHAGFNSPANNRAGYATREAAKSAEARYHNRYLRSRA